MRSTLKQMLLLCAGLAFGLLAFFLVQVVRQTSSLIGPLPDPNGYDDLVSAGESILGLLPEDSASADTRRSFLAHNINAIAQARLGLSRQIMVPLQVGPGAATNQARMGALGSIKSVARLLRAEGKLAELENRNDDALEAYLQMLEVGKQTMNGGVVIDSMMGIAIEAMGLAALKELQPKLNGNANARLAEELSKLGAEHESVSTIVKREEAWAKQVFRWRYHFIKLVQPKAFSAVAQSLKVKWDKHTKEIALLIEQAEAHASPGVHATSPN